MQGYYVDIQLLADPEVTPPVLMSALYSRLHRALVLRDRNAGGIAVSFPGYRTQPRAIGLGHCLRLLGSRQDLDELGDAGWQGGLRDRVEVSHPLPVPSTAAHRSLRRVQAKSNPERLRRRLMKRHGLTEDQALERIPDTAAETLCLPFLTLHSASTGQDFKLFLRLGPEQDRSMPGAYNTYGLSVSATTPWF